MEATKLHVVAQKMDVMEGPSANKKVMLISPNFGGGGAERSISKLSIQLTEKNYEVHFVVFNVFPGREQVYPIKGTLHVLDVPAGKSFVDKGFRLLDRIVETRKLKKKLGIDVSISFLEGADYVNILSKQKEKVVVSIRGSKESDEEISGLIGWVRKKILMPILYRKVDHIVCVSQGIKYEMEQIFSLDSGKTQVIYNSYDVDSIRILGNESLPDYAEKLFTNSCIITSGRLHPQKNHVGLIHSFAQLKKFENDSKLVILGTGELKSQLKDICMTLGLSVSDLTADELNTSADVVFLGYQKNPWMFIKRATLFVLSSSWEGFPNALAEAMCLGLAVISTNCPHGPAEILSDGLLDGKAGKTATITKYGALVPLLVDQDAYKTCAEVMGKFLSEDELRNSVGAAAVDRIRGFSQEVVVGEWQNVIEK